jgi:hypothetical protein
MKVVSDGVSEIQKFVDNLSFESPLSDADLNKSFAGAYRYIHALLIWNEQLGSAIKGKPNSDAFVHFRELLSDLAAVQLLLLAGMYKPARMMLRSSIENILRIVALEQGCLVAGFKFTYEVITVIKSSPLGLKTSPIKQDITSIVDGYSKLCAFTHAAAMTHMALRVPLVSVTKFDKADFGSIVDDLKGLASRYNRIIFALYYPHLKTASHKHRDFVLDALPKALKAHFSS